MYAMYPDWGPARHRDTEESLTGSFSSTVHSAAQASVQAGLDLRDNGGERPDDN